MSDLRIDARMAAIAATGVLIAALTGVPVSAAMTQDAANKAALDAYIYGFPLVLVDVTKEQATNVPKPTTFFPAPINQFSNVPEFPLPDNHAIVAPNASSPRYCTVSRTPLTQTELPMLIAGALAGTRTWIRVPSMQSTAPSSRM